PSTDSIPPRPAVQTIRTLLAIPAPALGGGAPAASSRLPRSASGTSAPPARTAGCSTGDPWPRACASSSPASAPPSVPNGGIDPASRTLDLPCRHHRQHLVPDQRRQSLVVAILERPLATGLAAAARGLRIRQQL